MRRGWGWAGTEGRMGVGVGKAGGGRGAGGWMGGGREGGSGRWLALTDRHRSPTPSGMSKYTPSLRPAATCHLTPPDEAPIKQHRLIEPSPAPGPDHALRHLSPVEQQRRHIEPSLATGPDHALRHPPPVKQQRHIDPSLAPGPDHPSVLRHQSSGSRADVTLSRAAVERGFSAGPLAPRQVSERLLNS